MSHCFDPGLPVRDNDSTVNTNLSAWLKSQIPLLTLKLYQMDDNISFKTEELFKIIE